MSKKKEQKKQIVSIFKRGPFWQYKLCSNQNVQKVQLFLNNFNAQLKLLIDPQKTFQQNYQILAQKMGYDTHPCLSPTPHKQVSQFPALKNNDYGQKYVVFLSHKIDIITLKLFGFLLSQYKLSSLKLSNNNLTKEQVSQVIKILEKQDSLTTLFFQWNSLQNLQNRKQAILSTMRPSLQHLILRDCKMGNEILKQLINKIKLIPQLKLKSLDLYGNQLTVQIKDQICTFIQQNKSLQFLGLSKNKLQSQDFIIKLVHSIGQIKLIQHQVQQHKQKQKLRDQIVERNKKRKKGTPQQPVPFLFDIKQTQQGKFYIKNITLKVLNLSTNGLTDQIIPHIRKFVQKQGKNIQLFIQGNKFSKIQKDTLKFYDNVIC